MTNQPWNEGPRQQTPGWQAQPPQGSPQSGWGPGQPQPHGFAGPGGGQPPREPSRLPLIIGVVVVVVAIIGVAAVFLTRPSGGPTSTGTPATSSSTSGPSEPSDSPEPPSGGEAEFTVDAAPKEVNGWVAQPVLEGQSGMYYAKEGLVDDAGLDIYINVTGTGLAFDVATVELEDARESSGGRVKCGLEGVLGQVCYVDTAEFGVLGVNPTAAVPDEDMTAISDAISGQHS